MAHTLNILGSGQDGGSPQLGSPKGAGPVRTASSVALTTDDGAHLLFDASPDIRSQYLRLAAGTSQPPSFDGVFITHCHMGHYAGLLQFGKEAAASDNLPLFAPASVLSFLARNQPWAALVSDGHLDPIPIDDVDASLGAVTVSAVAVPHRAEYSSTVGYSIAIDGHPWVFYLPDIDGWEEWPDAHGVLDDHEISLIDATFSSADELPGRDIAEIRHPLVPDTIERFADLTGDHTIILTHINHSNPLGLATASVTEAAHTAGFHIAFDGMVFHHG